MKWLNNRYKNTVKVPVLRRYRVKSGKESTFKSWLSAREQSPIKQTPQEAWHGGLPESVFFRETEAGLFLYWLAIEKPGGASILDSPKILESNSLDVLADCLEIENARLFEANQEMFFELDSPKFNVRVDHFLSGFFLSGLLAKARS